jgi:hypothetical protein
MAEKHSAVSMTTATNQFFLQQLWNFVKNTQSGILQFPTGNSARSGGSTTDPSTTDLSAGFGTSGDYLLIEPVNEYPGSGRWQIKFSTNNPGSSSDLSSYVEASWLGGWDTGTESFGSNVTTGAKNAWTYAPFTTSDTWYFSCSDSDTYANSSGNQTYSYIRVLFYDSSQADNDHFRGVYCGGYIPTEPDSDTKPVVFLARQVKQQDTSNAWGTRTDLNTGQLPGNYAHDVAGGSVTACVNSLHNDNYSGYRLSRSGNWVNPPTLVSDTANERDLGVFGRYTMLGGNYDRTDGASDSNAEYIIAGNTTLRWKPSA